MPVTHSLTHSLTRTYQETVDKIRYLVEECDHLASLNVTCDIYNGFSGFTTKLLQEIREDLPTVTIPVWTINNSPLLDVFSGMHSLTYSPTHSRTYSLTCALRHNK